MAIRDPDAALVAVFKHIATKNEHASREAGRPIFDDIEVCEIRKPGSKDVQIFPATVMSHWDEDPITRELTAVSYAERFRHQYQQFKNKAQQTKSGTPLDHAPFMTEGKRAELRAQNIYTVEALAAIEGNELKNLGPGGREFKNKAQEYIASTMLHAPDLKMAAELEAMKLQNALLQEDMLRLKSAQVSEGRFDGMSNDQLREFITTNSGQAPLGSMSRKTLIRMAQEYTATETAA